jgi:hypothetical protein
LREAVPDIISAAQQSKFIALVNGMSQVGYTQMQVRAERCDR